MLDLTMRVMHDLANNHYVVYVVKGLFEWIICPTLASFLAAKMNNNRVSA